jgi:hypothetical protein
MNKHLIILALILLLTDCSPTPTVAPPAPATNSNTPPVTIPAIPLPEDVIPTIVSTNISGPLWLQVLSPQDEAVVNTPQVDVIGLALPGAVVSVNDEILIVGDDQQFKTTATLDEGPNLIEIIASDENGHEISLTLTVTYEP